MSDVWFLVLILLVSGASLLSVSLQLATMVRLNRMLSRYESSDRKEQPDATDN